MWKVTTIVARALFAVVLCCLWLVVIERTAAAQSAASVAQARFEEGVRLFDGGEHEAALEQFRASLELVASPNSRLYVARCLRDLHRYAEAVSEYYLTAREAVDLARQNRRYRETQEAAEQEREAIADRVGWITISVTPPQSDLRVELNGRQILRHALGLAIPVDPGRVEIRAEASGFLPSVRELTISGGERETASLELTPLHDDQPSHSSLRRRPGLRVGTFVSMGLALAGGAAFTALAVLTRQQYLELESLCAGPCDPSFADDVERGQSLQISADVTLGFTLAVATAGVVLAIVTPWREPAAQQERAGGRRPSAVLPWIVRW